MNTKSFVFKKCYADEYEAWYKTPKGGFVDILEKEVIAELTQIKHGDKVLEIGCGTGHFSRYFEELKAEVTGLDTSFDMLKVARDKSCNVEVNFEAGDAFNLPYKDNSFDLVAMITVLEFIKDPKQALAEALRVSKGKVFLGILNRSSFLARKRKRSNKKVWQEAHFYVLKEILNILGRKRKIKWKSILFLPLVNSKILFNARLSLERLLSKFNLPFGAFMGVIIES